MRHLIVFVLSVLNCKVGISQPASEDMFGQMCLFAPCYVGEGFVTCEHIQSKYIVEN